MTVLSGVASGADHGLLDSLVEVVIEVWLVILGLLSNILKAGNA